MVEFSEDFSKRITGHAAVSQRVLYRLAPRDGEIPYFRGALDLKEFDQNSNLLMSIRALLSDFNANVSITQDGRVLVGDITVAIPGGMQ